MIRLGPIVCGGGWKSRRECRIKSWCTILFVVTFIAALALAKWIDVWGLLVPVALFVVTLIPFRHVRNEQPGVEKASVPNVPKHDLHNLH
jgi:hypothetical protein